MSIDNILEIFLALCFVGILWAYTPIVDAEYNNYVCRSEFEKVSGISEYRAYVIGGSDNLNFGKDIRCEVYWNEEYLTYVAFESGTLTEEMVETARYWMIQLPKHPYGDYFKVYECPDGTTRTIFKDWGIFVLEMDCVLKKDEIYQIGGD